METPNPPLFHLQYQAAHDLTVTLAYNNTETPIAYRYAQLAPVLIVWKRLFPSIRLQAVPANPKRKRYTARHEVKAE